MAWITAGAVIIGGLMASDSADDASDASSEASRDALRLQRDAYNDSTLNTALQRSVGQGALYGLADEFGIDVRTQERIELLTRQRAELQAKLGLSKTGKRTFSSSSPDKIRRQLESIEQKISTLRQRSSTRRTGATGIYDNLEMDPGYEFRLAEGEKALQRQQSAGGTRYGGAALKAAARYGQDYSSNEFSNAVNRRNSELGYLFSLAGFGQQGIATAGQAGTSSAANSGNILMQNATNQGNIAMNRGANINNAIQGGIQNYYTQSLLNDYNRRPNFSPNPGTGSIDTYDTDSRYA